MVDITQLYGGLAAVLMYDCVERFCSDICQVYFAIHLLINLAYHRSAAGYLLYIHGFL